MGAHQWLETCSLVVAPERTCSRFRSVTWVPSVQFLEKVAGEANLSVLLSETGLSDRISKLV